MNREEFEQIATQSGYGSKKSVERYAAGRTEFTEDDFIKLYRMNSDRRVLGNPKWRSYEGAKTTKRLVNIADDETEE